ncbi:toxin biosynthesis [Stagonosporopsis vannaccii]|nr:toxin biosynthesis [Stagonosporopsis vannaccii]
MSAYFRVVEHVIRCAHTREYFAATAGGALKNLDFCVKQYIPLDNSEPQNGGATIIAAHANGFPKELYEPLWEDLYIQSKHDGFQIRSIWIADVWNQGQSGVLNETELGNDPSWFDHTRDLMNLINEKQDEMPQPLLGVGHSMGGMQLTYLALSHPRLFHSLALLDPVIQRPNGSIKPAVLSTRRRDIWPSQLEAEQKMRASSFYKSWDPRVLDRWIKHGLRRVPTEIFPLEGNDDKRVTLTTSKHQELFTFLRPTYRNMPYERFDDLDPTVQAEHPHYPFYRSEPAKVFELLPELRPSTLYVFGKNSELSDPQERNLKMHRTGSGIGGSGGKLAGRVEQRILDCGHLVAMERVQQCAESISKFFAKELTRYQVEFGARSRYLGSQERLQRITIDQRWKEQIDPKKQPAGLKLCLSKL